MTVPPAMSDGAVSAALTIYGTRLLDIDNLLRISLLTIISGAEFDIT